MIYGTVVRKPYTYPIMVKRKSKTQLIKDFPDVKIINKNKAKSKDFFCKKGKIRNRLTHIVFEECETLHNHKNKFQVFISKI